MLAVGNDELGEEITEVHCTCGATHPIEYGTTQERLADGTRSKPVKTKLLGFYRCGDKIYLASIHGKKIMRPQEGE